MIIESRALIKRLLLALCIWEVIVPSSAMLIEEVYVQHTLSLAGLFGMEVYSLLTGLGVITILTVSAIAMRLTRLAASLTGFAMGPILSVIAGYV